MNGVHRTHKKVGEVFFALRTNIKTYVGIESYIVHYAQTWMERRSYAVIPHA